MAGRSAVVFCMVLALAFFVLIPVFGWDPRSSVDLIVLGSTALLLALIHYGLQRLWLGNVDRIAEVSETRGPVREGSSIRFDGHVGNRAGTVALSTMAHRGRFTYSLEARMPVRSRLTAELRPETGFTQIEKWLGARELVLGDRAFDTRFDIHTSDRDTLRHALSPAVREAILLAGVADVSVSAGEVVLRSGFTSRGRRSEVAIGKIARRQMSIAGLLAEGIEDAEARSPGRSRPTLNPPAARAVGPVIGVLTAALLLWWCWVLVRGRY